MTDDLGHGAQRPTGPAALAGPTALTAPGKPSRLLVTLLFVGVVLAGITLAGPTVAGAPATAVDTNGSLVAPTASCSLSEQYPEPGQSVSIYAFDSENADSYRYDLDGDGSPDTQFTQDQFYTTSYSEGTYQPVVYAYNSTSEQSATATCPEMPVAPNEPPSAQLSYDPANPTTGQTVTFDATGSVDADGDIMVLQWDFGADGSYEVNESTELGIDGTETRTYETPGTKLVRITVHDNDGGTDSTTIEFPVDTPQASPTPSFTYSPQPAVAGEQTTLDASGSSDPDGTIQTYRWDFDGDGATDFETSNSITTYEYAYDESGAGYAVTELTVVDDQGNSATTALDVEIIEADPVARCSLSSTGIEPGQSVTIDASASTNADQYQYDTGSGSFGDFTTESQRTVTLNEVGEYAIRVRVWANPSERSNTTDCGTVTVARSNVGPTAEFEHSPIGPRTGQTVTFDASASTDPDGSIQTYRWDFDGDGTVDKNTSNPTTTHTYSSPNAYLVRLTVADNAGATGTSTGVVDVNPGEEPIARCQVTPQSAQVGETVTIDASASERADDYQFDTGSGSYGDFTENPTTTVTYDEPGTYSSRVRVFTYPSERSSEVECPTVTITQENQPPTATFTVTPSVPSGGEQVTFDASNATDADGQVVTYHWDFDGDGTTDTTTQQPVVTHTYQNETSVSPALIVVDDDGATDRSRQLLEPDDTPLQGIPGGSFVEFPFPPWILIPGIGGGLGMGYLACRLRSSPTPSPKPAPRTTPDDDLDIPAHLPKGGAAGKSGGGGISNFASGTFETPKSGETVAVTDLGFEPDLVLFTATNNVSRSDHEVQRTDGWTYGKLARADDGTLTQNVVSVATDARTTGSAVGANQTGMVVDLLVHDDESAGGLAGSVTKTTAGGFEIAFDGDSLPERQQAEGFTVLFQAFKTDDDAAVEVGYFPTPTEPSVQSVDLGIDASFVALTATNAVTAADTASVTDGAIGVSHGEAVRSPAGAVQQHVANSTVVPGTVVRNGYAGYQDRALHLLDGVGGDLDDRTSARVTDLGETMELTYDEVAAGETGGPLITYLAVETADHRTPAVGHFRVPAPDADYPTRVEVGFDPAMVELTTCNLDVLGADQVVADHSFGFGWSHGVAMPDADGGVAHHLLHGSLEPDDVFGRVLPPVAGDEGGTHAAADGGMSSSVRTEGTPAAARVLALDDDGHVTGRDDVLVSATTSTGFQVETTGVSTGRRNTNSEVRPVVFYRAWPHEGEL